MKINNKIKGSVLLVYLVIPFILAGCGTDKLAELGLSENANTEEKKDSLVNDEVYNNKEENVIEKNNSEEEIIIENKNSKNELAGTCPKGLHCGAPGRCGLFMDNNNNDLCDRGE